MFLTGCNHSKPAHYDSLYSLDSAAIEELTAHEALSLTLDSLRNHHAADTAWAALSFEITNQQLREKQFAQLKTYNEQAQKLMKAITLNADEMREQFVSMNINVAEMFGSLGMYDRASQMLLREYKTALLYHQTTNQCVILHDLGSISNERRNWDQAIGYFNQSRPLIDTVSHPELLVYNYNNLAWSYRGKKQYNKALEFMMLAMHCIPPADSALLKKIELILANHYIGMCEYSMAAKQLAPVIRWLEDNGLETDLSIAYEMQATIQWKTGDMSNAKASFDKAIELSRNVDPPSKATLANDYANFCNELGDKDAVISSLRYAIKVDDEIIKGSQQGVALTQLYDDELNDNWNYQQVNERRNREKLIIIIILSVIMLVITAVSALLYRRQKQSIKNNLEEIAIQKQKFVAVSVNVEKGNALIDHLRKLLPQLQNAMKNGAKVTAIKHMREMTKLLTNTDYDSTVLQDANNDLYSRLLAHYPDLTPGDLRLAALLRQGLTSKEIAEITFREPRSVNMARARLRKRCGLTRDQDLIAFLNTV